MNRLVVFYELDEAFATTITHSKHRSLQEVFFATSKQALKLSGWIAVHPYALDSVVKQLSLGVQSVIDFSTSGARDLRFCVPQTCVFRTFEPSLCQCGQHELKLRDLLSESYEDAIHYIRL